jgi:transcriptional regulator with XRE-family HTH domain/Zn-dependent peptidase ImmA (M78 family)
MTTMGNWESPQYQRILSAKSAGDTVVVTFEDGTVATVERDRLVPPGTSDADWEGLSFGAREMIIPASPRELEVPWTTIRLLSDVDFAKHWADVAENEAKEIGRQLRALRVARGMSSKELAERAGITPQSLSRIEHGRHDVVYTTLKRILAAMGTTLGDLAKLSEQAPQTASLGDLLDRLQWAGVRKELVLKHIVPQSVLVRIQEAGGEDAGDVLAEIAEHVSRVFGWTTAEILGGGALTLDKSRVEATLFKAPARIDEHQASAYAVFAHYLALVVLQATEGIQGREFPADEGELARVVRDGGGEKSLESLLRIVWDFGIPVLPLRDPGAFHGACWMIRERKVIALKQVTAYQGRWHFDLAHELWHAAAHLQPDQRGYLEPGEITPFRKDSVEEQEASQFAERILLAGRAEELAEACVGRAKGRVEFLKNAVDKVAASEGVRVDILANYLAYRLAMQDISWWGAANNLQVTEPEPFEIARELLIANLDLSRVNPVDRDLLLRAVT